MSNFMSSILFHLRRTIWLLSWMSSFKLWSAAQTWVYTRYDGKFSHIYWKSFSIVYLKCNNVRSRNPDSLYDLRYQAAIRHWDVVTNITFSCCSFKNFFQRLKSNCDPMLGPGCVFFLVLTVFHHHRQVLHGLNSRGYQFSHHPHLCSGCWVTW